jgi:hypothetical protein
MKRILFETAKLAVEKGYPICRQQYYNTQYSLLMARHYLDSNVVHNYSEETCKLYDDIIPALYQAELQEWLRDKHGVSVLVYLDETLSYIWTITGLHPRASIQEFHMSNEVWCGHYEDCLEAGLQAALRLI